MKWNAESLSSQTQNCVNPLPNNKNVDSSRLKVFADNNLNVGRMMEFAFIWLEDIVGRGENARYLHFLLFELCSLNLVPPRPAQVAQW